MRKFWVILQREYAQLVHKKSFLFTTLLTPVIMGVMMFLPAFLMQKGTNQVETIAVIDLDGHAIGHAVWAGMAAYRLSDTTRAAYQLDTLMAEDPSDSARYRVAYDRLVQNIRDGQLTYLLVIRPNAHLADSNLLLVTNSDNMRSISRFESQLGQALSRRRVDVSQINIPIDSVMALTRGIDLPRQDTKGESVSPEIKFMFGMILMMLIYMLILVNGQWMMQAVIDEKSARIMEVLVSSASPFQIMAGKIFGSGLAALTQVAIWIAGGLAMLAFSASSGTQLDPGMLKVVFNPASIVCFAVFLVLGYLLFSTVFALIGSLVNSTKDAQPLMMPVIMILFIPGLFVGMAALQTPDEGWIKAFSFIPFYTPLVMMIRVAVLAPSFEGNPLLSPIMLQAIISIIGMIVVLAGTIWVAGRIFRIGILMYGKRPTMPEIMRWVSRK